MTSQVVLRRLTSILRALEAGHSGGIDVSSASMGRDRELFINLVLSNIISVPFRVGTGDIVDRHDHLSAQSDIVIEYANTLSFPNIYPDGARLYLAESVCAVIEVKSTVHQQWDDVVKAAERLNKLERSTGWVAGVGGEPPAKIPLFAIGYKGWKDSQSARDRIVDANKNGLRVSGVLQLDPCFYVGAPKISFANHSATGPAGLYGFLLSIEELTSSMVGSKPPFKTYID